MLHRFVAFRLGMGHLYSSNQMLQGVLNIKFGRVVFAENYLRDTASQDRRFIMDLIKEAILEGSDQSMTSLIEDPDDMSTFRALAPAPWVETYFELPPLAEEWLTHRTRGCSLVVSYEMPEWMRCFLNRHRISWLDIRLSPVRFSLDLMLAVRSSDDDTNTFLHTSCIPERTICMYATQMGASARRLLHIHLPQKSVDFHDSLVFIGQTASDAALISPPGRLLTVSDYTDQLKVLAEGKNRIYYHSHPFGGEHQTHEVQVLGEIIGREILQTELSTNMLLAIEPGALLTGISSGLLQEAHYFNQRSEILFRPVCPLEGESAYAQFYIADLMSPDFWRNVMFPGVTPFSAGQGVANQFRYLHDLWFSYDNHIMEKGPGKILVESSRRHTDVLINLEARLINLEQSWQRLSGNTVFRMLKSVRRLFCYRQ